MSRPSVLPMSTVLIASAALLGGVAFTASAAATSPTSDTESAGQACELVDTDWTASSRVEPHRTELFGDYSDSGVAWTGGDSTYSVKLPRGRTVWLFSDTFLGPVNDDLSRPIETPFLNNSFVVERGDELTTVTGGTSGEPDSLVPPDRERSWNWLGAGIAGPRSLDVMFMEFAAFGDGQWDWAWEQNKLVRFDPKTYEVREIVPMPSESGVQWASWLERNDGFTYIYGVDDQGLNKYMHLARVAGKDLTTSWEYWTGAGWSSTETDSAAIMPGVANEYSVSKFRDGYLLVTQDTTEVFSRNIVAYTACNPWGPFVPATTLYFAPDGLGWDDPDEANPNIFTYNAHEHPHLRRGNRLLVTYNVNSLEPNELYDDVTIYRPRFIEVELTPAR